MNLSREPRMARWIMMGRSLMLASLQSHRQNESAGSYTPLAQADGANSKLP